jgi:hypothetical protein
VKRTVLRTGTKERPGVIVQTVLTAECEKDLLELFPGGGDLIRAQMDRARQIEAEATGDRAKCAKVAARLFDDALVLLQKGDADGVACAVIWGMQNLWLADVRQVEPEIITGARARRGTSRGNASKSEVARSKQTRWQKAAAEVWTRNPTLTRADVAKILADRLGGAAGYIRKKITRPT